MLTLSLRRALLGGLFLLFFALQTAVAAAVTINFDSLAPGTVLSNQYVAQGATFSPNVFSGPDTGTSITANWATNTDMTIVDSNGSDIGSLGGPALVSGNILRSFSGWGAENGNASFLITFSPPVSNFSATFAGVFTGSDVTIWAYNGATLLGTVSGAAAGQFVLSYSNATPITSVAVRPGTYVDWVAVDNITFTQVAGVSPTLQNAASRIVQGAAGTFDLPLTLVAPPNVNHNPTTEPRQSPTQAIVFTFDKPINGATVVVSEGTATAGAPAFAGNNVTVPLSGVANQQYVTVSLTNVASTDGGTGGSGSARVGFLAGDVNQSRVVTIADLGLVNAKLAQPVTAANYLMDVNATGTLTVGDKGVTNANLTKALPTP
jgi:hypothetical protein